MFRAHVVRFMWLLVAVSTKYLVQAATESINIQEGEEGTLTCSADKEDIYIETAKYGRTGPECGIIDVINFVSGECDGLSTCTLTASNDLGGDPCNQVTYNVLYTTYECAEPAPSPTPLFDRDFDFKSKTWKAFGKDWRFILILLTIVVVILFLALIVWKIIQLQAEATARYTEPSGIHHTYWGPDDMRDHQDAHVNHHVPARDPPSPMAKAVGVVGAIAAGALIASQV